VKCNVEYCTLESAVDHGKKKKEKQQEQKDPGAAGKKIVT
jgi:hypothetical protein